VQLAKTLRPSDATISRVGPRMLAGLIASHTVTALVEGELLDQRAAPELLQEYGNQLDHDLACASGCAAQPDVERDA
jgi:hypothetical protein